MYLLSSIIIVELAFEYLLVSELLESALMITDVIFSREKMQQTLEMSVEGETIQEYKIYAFQ